MRQSLANKYKLWSRHFADDGCFISVPLLHGSSTIILLCAGLTRYQIGQLILVPLAFHSAVSLTLSLILFPFSQSTVFTTRLQDVLSSLASMTKQHHHCLQQDVTASNFSTTSIVATVSKAEGALAMLTSAASLQKFDIIYSRFASTDYAQLHSLTRGLVARASGMNMYYTLIDPTRERFPVVSAPSTPATSTYPSPLPSRAPSPSRDSEQPNANADIEKGNNPGSSDGGTMKQYSHLQAHHRKGRQHRVPHKRRHLPHNIFNHSGHSHSSLLHFALSRTTKTESAVGVFESLHYLNLEATHMFHPNSAAHVSRATELLRASSQDLLKSCEHALQSVSDWLGSVQDNYFRFWMTQEEKLQVRKDRIKKYGDLHREFSLALEEFTNKKRFGPCLYYIPPMLISLKIYCPRSISRRVHFC